MADRIVIPKKMWDAALNETQKSVPWYDLPFTIREFTRLMTGARS